ncbi:MAG: muconolactone Delta-isomerase [Parasphingorhabdus sp.]|uniref:muconolactone Delta-isomerase n=1 Tax=Parasphingorhabdus sp. TaxID=2709688 RepID=UPI00329773F5
MLFMVEMVVNPPLDIDKDEFEALKATEKARAEELQNSGKWRHLWRVTGQYANVSIFDVADAQELHDIMMSLPLYPFMDVHVTSLCQHPSAIEQI